MKAVYKWWATLVFVAIVVQIGLAGYGAFYVVGKTDDGGTVDEDTVSKGFDPHVAWGYLAVGLSTLILLVIGLIAGYGRWRLGRHGLLFALFILQVALAIGGYGAAAIGFFHPVNALVMFAVSGSLVYSVWRRRSPLRPPLPRRRSATSLGLVVGRVADPERCRHADVGEVHREPCRRVRKVVAVVHPDPRVVGAEPDDVAVAG